MDDLLDPLKQQAKKDRAESLNPCAVSFFLGIRKEKKMNKYLFFLGIFFPRENPKEKKMAEYLFPLGGLQIKKRSLPIIKRHLLFIVIHLFSVGSHLFQIV